MTKPRPSCRGFSFSCRGCSGTVFNIAATCYPATATGAWNRCRETGGQGRLRNTSPATGPSLRGQRSRHPWARQPCPRAGTIRQGGCDRSPVTCQSEPPDRRPIFPPAPPWHAFPLWRNQTHPSLQHVRPMSPLPTAESPAIAIIPYANACPKACPICRLTGWIGPLAALPAWRKARWPTWPRRTT